MRTRLLMLGLLVATTAAAQVYTWVDGAGVTHYTNDPKAVPAAVKAVETAGEDIGEIEAAPPRPAPPDPQEAETLWKRSMLSTHNAVRATRPGRLDPLEWDDGATLIATKVANACKYSAGDPGSKSAKNMAWARTALAPIEVVRKWADEVRDWDAAANTCRGGQDCSHYARLISPEVRAVGCAHARCTTNSPAANAPVWHLWVCTYAIATSRD